MIIFPSENDEQMRKEVRVVQNQAVWKWRTSFWMMINYYIPGKLTTRWLPGKWSLKTAMYFVLTMGICQPAMLVHQRLRPSRWLVDFFLVLRTPERLMERKNLEIDVVNRKVMPFFGC